MMADWRRGASTIALSLMLLFAGSTSTVAVAQDDPLEALLRSVFEAMDTNEDGALDQSEAYAASGRIFNALDQNWDGFLNPIEASTPPRQFVSEATQDDKLAIESYLRSSFSGLDLDGDNWVSRSEMHWLSGQLFVVADREGDGLVTLKELEPLLRHSLVGASLQPPLTKR